MTKESPNNQPRKSSNKEVVEISRFSESLLKQSRKALRELKAEERLLWALKQFGEKFILTTSFGIQSAVLLNMVKNLDCQNRPKIIWVDTGYLPEETYVYAEQLINQMNINIEISQSEMSPARMEAIHGRLWETGSVEDLEKYHFIRKVEPLEKTFEKLKILCWGSGVRGGQTDHRRSMSYLDPIRERLSLRPLLEWSKKDIYYYMQENSLPQHPLFEKGYSTVGDWHSSGPDNNESEGRSTRFGGLKQECGIHLS